MSIRVLSRFTLAVLSVAASTVSAEYIEHVDPFIGTTGGGNTFPGPTLPFGFIQVSPDTGQGSGAGGYKFNKNINGFSQQHINGMGGPILGEISLLPVTGPINEPAALSSTGKSLEQSSPGYYTVTLAPWDVKVELTAGPHLAYQRYTFPASDQAHVLVNAGHCLFGIDPAVGKKGSWGSAWPTGGEVTIDPANKEVSGFMVYKGGRSTSLPWKVYFVSKFDTAFDSVATWSDDKAVKDQSTTTAGKEIGAVLNFKTTAGQVVNSRTAVSWRSVDQARGYLTNETSDFEQTRAAAGRVWEDALGKIAVEGGSADDQKEFYSALYHAHMAPNDWTNESPDRFGSMSYYENQLCMWDTFRTVNPLHTLIHPEVASAIANSIINFYKVDGWTGDSRSAHQFEHVQNGSSADNILADAYVKKLPGVDFKEAYEAIHKNAFVDANPDAKGRPKLGRFRLDDYRKYHYLPTDVISPSDPPNDIQAVSRTLEYVYNDFCVYTLAKEFGTPEDVKDLESRLTWYKNLWDAEGGGFMRGKKIDGSWHTPFDPLKPETGREYYEGHAWTWSWYVPHDPQGLIDLLGGDEPFNAKLSIACDKYYEAYNEPAMLQTYLFIHAGRPDLTQKYVHTAMKHFTSGTNGLPGNDDSGTTSAWLVWTMLGIYPNAGQPYYYIGSPTFSRTVLSLPAGKQLIIRATDVSTENIYVQSATLNGKPWDQSWLKHEDIIGGAELVLQMGTKPSAWGTKIRPPSFALKNG